MVEAVLSGTEPQRKGAADVFATNLRSAEFRSFCEDSLVKLFDDSSREVQSEAASCFGEFENAELGEYENIVDAFIGSHAFISGHGRLFHAMEDSTAKIPQLICKACKRFMEITGSEISDTSKEIAYDARTVAELVIRAYSQSDDPDIKAECLDLIDRMLQLGLREPKEFLEAYER